MKEGFHYAEIVKQVLVAMFHKESQLGRSMRENTTAVKAEFKKNLLHSILQLVEKADNGTLTNDNIRGVIKRLTSKNDVSVGQAQKVINVYLKYYCILKGQTNLIGELDCPVDSGIAKAVWKELSSEDKKDLENRLLPHGIPSRFSYFYMTELKNMDYPIYEFLQAQLERIGNGVRVKPDIEIYDKRRIEDFLSSASNNDGDK